VTAGAFRPRILLVEDDLSVHVALTDVLASEGYDVVHAFDGIDAVQRFFSNDDIALVLLDLNLPHRSGWDALEPLTRHRPQVPIVVITARPNQLEIANAAGVAALMEKPLDFPLLLAAMREVLAEPSEERLARLSGLKPLTRHLTWRN
jgi:DNA-binding response OmpR family regulator